LLGLKGVLMKYCPFAGSAMYLLCTDAICNNDVCPDWTAINGVY
jgi:hypothetical protein